MDRVPTDNRSGLNVGALIHDGAGLTTREVLALLHEVCGQPGTAFPQTPEDLWLTPTGELLIARSGQPATPTDPRTAVASLLETMLPADDRNPTVPDSLRGLPTRLRAASGGVGPQDRLDLRSILSWHLGGDARQITQQLMHRITHREAGAVAAAAAVEAAAAAPAALEELPAPPAAPEEVASAPGTMEVPGPSNVHDDLDLYADDVEAPWVPARAESPPPPRAAPAPLRSLVSALAVGALFVAIG